MCFLSEYILHDYWTPLSCKGDTLLNFMKLASLFAVFAESKGTLFERQSHNQCICIY